MCSNVAATDKRLQEHIQDNKDVHGDIWEAINNLRNRLPIWATVVIATLSAMVGWLAK